MIGFESHKKKLEDALCIRNPETEMNCIDKIDEKLWQDNVMPALNQISLKAAVELQQETGKRYLKDWPRTEDSVNKITGKITFEEFQKQRRSDIFVEEVQKRMGNLNPYDLLFTDSNGNIEVVRRLREYSEAPPTRLLSLTLSLCYFLGFLEVDKGHQMDEENGIGAWKRIEKAYEAGKASHLNSKSGQVNAKTEETIEPATNQDENSAKTSKTT
jgi:hypothetical protein